MTMVIDICCATLLMLVVIALIFALISALIVGIRNNSVCDFRLTIIKLISDRVHERLNLYENDDQFLSDQKNYDTFYARLDSLRDKYSYERMIYSFKPLKLEYWFTEDEIKLLTTPQISLEK